MKPTLFDIAQKAGVSPSTVSLVFSQKGKISKEVQLKVKAIAEDLGYRPVQNSKQAKSPSIAILFHFDHNLAHTWNILRQVTLSLQEHLYRKNYLTLLIPITFDMSDDEILEKVINSRATAVFSMHFGREKLFSRFEKLGIPVIVIINSQFQTKFHTVCADNFQGSYEATSYLLKLGHRNIIYAEFDIYQLPSTLSDRYLGFYKAMKEHNIDNPEMNKLHLNINDENEIKEKFTNIFQKENKPTAIFFIDDYLAIHSIGILNDLGYFFPKDISIIAGGEVLDYNEPFIPKITTMSTSPELLGKFSAEMMFNIFESSPENSNVLKIKQQLIDRGSCKSIL